MDRKMVRWNSGRERERRRSGANDLDAIPTRVRVAPVECGVHQEYTIARLHKSIWIGGTRPRSICCHYFAIPAKRTRWTVDQGREEAHSVRYAARNRCEIYWRGLLTSLDGKSNVKLQWLWYIHSIDTI